MTSTIKVDNIQKVSDGSNIIKKCGSTITIGSSGQTVAVACGATTSGMGRTGTVDWCTTAKTSPFTSVSGKGYFVNTTGGAVTVTLPSSPSAGDIVAIADYANTFATACKAVTVGRGGSKINGVCSDATLSTDGQSVTLVYVDATRGWKTVTDSTADVTGVISYNVQYLVLAGGGGGAIGEYGGGGGGAGGFRTVASKNFSVQQGSTIPITVGAGGAGGTANPYHTNGDGDSGSPSIFSTITSAGGGGAGGGNQAPGPVGSGKAGGSGGGGSGPGGNPVGGANFGAGNTPPVSPPQGNPGGQSVQEGGGGGGGAGAVGGNSSGPPTASTGGAGGAGTASCISGSPVTRGGGGGGTGAEPAGGGGAGGSGGGGAGRNPVNGTANPGTANTGGGGGATNANSTCAPAVGGNGGSGVVIIRYVTSDSPSASGGTKTTSGSDSIHTFNSSGTFTA